MTVVKITYVTASSLNSDHNKSCGYLIKSNSKFNIDKNIIDKTYPKRLKALINGLIPSNNKIGVTGISINSKNGKYRAELIFQGKNHYLGEYNTLDEAKKVRKKLKINIFKKNI